MITKIDTRKIEHQSNIKIFVWKYDNLIENKNKLWILIQNQSHIEG
jgi:hypothetical protein